MSVRKDVGREDILRPHAKSEKKTKYRIFFYKFLPIPLPKETFQNVLKGLK